MNLHIIVMGVSGSGKSTVGEKLAEALNLPFLEGDSLHPKSNVDKMASGIPLQDEDRWPWLDKIGERMATAEQGLIVSCSSLKKSYRERLRAAVGGQLAFVFLDGSFEVLHEHMGHRTGHFMPVTMLESQLATLESPVGEPLVFRADVVDPIEKIVAESLEWFRSMKAELS
ncbi:gluconokinase [Brucella pseudogrignonensis]|uniref:gluconokinase n=1 Tax=Brucella pseudogrignonensis TaxID=419475 RepID=UPI000CFB53F0|nr:gluconokinase [Brucella pseudogrignonensis]MQP40731.1 AAA family ATPase [Ochrobactrum sp. MYb237]PQZ40699.1 gluconokinase [Brucella pseudogrignonensis]PRA40582.1 gluconokinase [Brucella pseudogrignonensis]PRA69178.1 gluconokinase [Brucella pseudogrignonensis]